MLYKNYMKYIIETKDMAKSCPYVFLYIEHCCVMRSSLEMESSRVIRDERTRPDVPLVLFIGVFEE